MRILAFSRYAGDAASTRYRLLQFLPALSVAGIELRWRPFFPDGHMQRLVAGKGPPRQELPRLYAERLRQLREEAPVADLLWIYGELFPFVPAMLERAALPREVPIVYDWDDAFNLAYAEHRRLPVRALLGTKHEQLLRGASAVTCGNAHLQDYAGRFCPRTLLLPTVVDTEIYQPSEQPERRPVIGWIGSPSSWCNVRPLLPMLRRLCEEEGVDLRIVGAGRAAERDRFPGLQLVDWSEHGEVAEVQSFDIGIMPLVDQPFQRGKSGFKLIQYMACGLPVVASPVGVNADIVEDGVNGFLASGEAKWGDRLRQLIRNPALRRSFGTAGRQRVIASYSLQSQAPRLIELFKSLQRGQA